MGYPRLLQGLGLQGNNAANAARPELGHQELLQSSFSSRLRCPVNAADIRWIFGI